MSASARREARPNPRCPGGTGAQPRHHKISPQTRVLRSLVTKCLLTPMEASSPLSRLTGSSSYPSQRIPKRRWFDRMCVCGRRACSRVPFSAPVGGHQDMEARRQGFTNCQPIEDFVDAEEHRMHMIDQRMHISAQCHQSAADHDMAHEMMVHATAHSRLPGGFGYGSPHFIPQQPFF